ncbi:MAG TPA: GH3 auxin-responsive promoter family protein, partial [Blastocatellia bacterium]|nr:GH3 auxin-responsive promoter family protein [Blastocatellia bacterium]
YDDIEEWIARQKNEEGNILVSERVLFYEKTSGSSGPAKYIPYTRSLRNSFNSMFAVWLCDLLDSGPAFETGKVFMTISPAFNREQKTGRGVRVGLEDDSEYLSEGFRQLLKPFLVLPAAIKRIQDPALFRRAVATLLLAEDRLEIISIWHPALLEIILDYIEANCDTLSEDLKRGSIDCCGVDLRFKPATGQRLALLARDRVEWREVWPHLKLISCWTGAHSATTARRVAERFRGVFIQGKGLLATEAPITLPLIEAGGFVPLPAEVFYEFLDDAGRIRLLHEVKAGREYEIILTQKGGLCRYRIGDRVRVTHRYRETPCMEFVGRADAVCDLAGEKLNERFVERCLEALLDESTGFQTLLPVMSERGECYYVLLADRISSSADSIESALDEALCEAFHYRNARLLGQLGRVRAIEAPGARDLYYDYFVKKGMKLGDIKQSCLIRNPEDAASLLAHVTQRSMKA